MSGIEIVGLVLGALPLLAKSIESYSEALSTMQRILSPRIELRKIRRRVKIALQIFRNTVKLLLLKIVDEAEATDLLQEPGSKKWLEAGFEQKLRELLGDSYSAWYTIMEDINSAVGVIRASLRASFEEVDHLVHRNTILGIF